MKKPTFFQALDQFPRFLVRATENARFLPAGTLENMLIYDDFIALQQSGTKPKKGEIYTILAEKFGYGSSTIRRKIHLMASTDFNPNFAHDVENYALYLHLLEKRKNQSELETEDDPQDSNHAP